MNHKRSPTTDYQLPFFMFVTLLPLRGILFQGLFLLIAIALESFILHKILNLSQRTSIECSASVNLFSTIIGWLIFFAFEPLLPGFLRQQLFNFILFGTPAQTTPYSLFIKIVYLLLYRILMLLFTLWVELLLLESLFKSFFPKLKDEIKPPLLEDSKSNNRIGRKYTASYESLKLRAVFLANFCSNCTVTLLLIFVI